MARNGSGTYSLPALNPVVTGTVISSTWANNTLNDIAAALTASVANDGQTPILGAGLWNGPLNVAGIFTNTANTQPCFEYYKSVADVTAGTGTVKFDTASFTQQGAGYDPATGVFTVPAGQAGFWDIRSQLLKYQEGVETIQNINIKVNGTVVATGSAYASGTTTPKSLAYPFVSRILKLAAGDLVTITTTSISIGNVAEPGIANSFFSGRLIG